MGIIWAYRLDEWPKNHITFYESHKSIFPTVWNLWARNNLQTSCWKTAVLNLDIWYKISTVLNKEIWSALSKDLIIKLKSRFLRGKKSCPPEGSQAIWKLEQKHRVGLVVYFRHETICLIPRATNITKYNPDNLFLPCCMLHQLHNLQHSATNAFRFHKQLCVITTMTSRTSK